MLKHYFNNITLIFLIQFTAVNSSYSVTNDEDNNKYCIEHTLNNSSFKRVLPDSIISMYKERYNNLIPANKLFVEPIHLLMLYELFKTTIATLNKHEVDYWLIGETLINCQKFGGFAPWQNNAHIAINYEKCRTKIRDISKDLEEKGIIFRCFEHMLNLQDTSYLLFNKQGFTEALKKHEPSYKTTVINAKYDSLDNKVNPISLAIVPYKVTDNNTYSLISYEQEQCQGKPTTERFATSDIYPLNTTELVNLSVNIANNVDVVLNSYACGKNFYKVYIGKKGRTYYNPIVIEDIRQYPELSSILSDFLEFTFKKYIGD